MTGTMVPPEVLDDAFRTLDGVDRAFAKRVYGGDLGRYQARLALVGFDRLDTVLDAGCGLGQWSLAMGRTAREVVAIDTDPKGLHVLARIAASTSSGHVRPIRASTERIPLGAATVDGVFSYSVVYFTDWRQSLAEFRRVLRPGGRLYLNTNALGWFLYLMATGHNASAGYAPRRYAARSLANTLMRRREGFSLTSGSQVTGVRAVLRVLHRLGFRTVARGGDGTIDVTGRGTSMPFFKGRRFGVPATYEILAEVPP